MDMKGRKNSQGAILLEYHRHLMMLQRHRFGFAILVLLVSVVLVSAYFYFDQQATIAGFRFNIENTKNSEREFIHLQIKDKILTALGKKPLTVGQALDVCDVIMTQSQVPAPIVFGVLEQESMYKVGAISEKGAKGLAQVMPATFKAYSPNPLIKNFMDPVTNVRASINYLSDLHSQYKDWRTVLRVYQAGPKNAKNKEFDWYANAVLARVDRYEHHLE